jgi:hypothetical protein
MLAFRRFKGSHAGSDMADHTFKMMKKLGLLEHVSSLHLYITKVQQLNFTSARADHL